MSEIKYYLINDRLLGKEECESIMDEIEVISKEEAVKFAGGRV